MTFLVTVLILPFLLNGEANGTPDQIHRDEVEVIPDSYLNLTTNSLWTMLIKNCKHPTMSCVEKNMYTYLQDTLDYPHDYEFTSFMKFRRNDAAYTVKPSEEEKDANNTKEYVEEEDNELRPPIEEISRSLQEKSMRFLMTHDVELQLPDTIFEGSTLKLSPRSLDDNGALVRLELIPSGDGHDLQEGRFFKKIKKFIQGKLLYALLAILLVIKLLAAKFLFFMPMVVGAVAAKKLLVKVLLFLFPALKWLFKLCHYAPHGANLHHHKHHISHIHHVAHGHHSHPPFHHHGHGHHDSVEVIAPHSDGPPHWGGQSSLHHSVDLHEPHKPLYNPHEQDFGYYSDGPSFGHDVIHRQDTDEEEEENYNNEVQPYLRKKPPPILNRPMKVQEIENLVLKAEKEALIKAKLQQEKLRIQEENMRLQLQVKQALQLQEKLRQQAQGIKSRVPPPQNFEVPRPKPPTLNPYLQTPPPPPVRTAPAPVYSQPQPVQNQAVQKPVQGHLQQPVQQPVKKDLSASPSSKTSVEVRPTAFEQALHQAATITYDPFYSPILDKIDNILNTLGFKEEPCRERLICSMYKNPGKFSPHSNLLSAELSRDTKELQKPKTTNAAVVRFYRYVQAARDGQDQRECLRLYPTCPVNTEQ